MKLEPTTPNRWDHLLGLALTLCATAILLTTSTNLGMNRDEGFYVEAAEAYAPWWRAFLTGDPSAMDRDFIDRAWGVNHEHPSLPKSLFALTWLVQQETRVFPEDSMAFRFAGMLMSSAALWILYLFGTRLYGRLAGLYAALAYALIPSVFYHAHLDCFDTPVVTMLLLVTYAYYRSLRQPVWAVWTGITYGLCLETKHNAWILLGVFVVHFAWMAWCERSRRKSGAIEGLRVSLVPYWLFGILLLGPTLFVAMWPWLWHDTIPRIGEYIGFHVHHVHYNIAFLGRTYFNPPSPFGWAWLLSLFTVPLVTLVVGVLGMGLRARTFLPPPWAERVLARLPKADPWASDVLVLGGFLTPMLVFTLPSTPMFGGNKHFLIAFAHLALFGGVAAVRITRALQDELTARLSGPSRAWVPALALAVLLSSPLRDTVHSHPFGLSFYTAAAGGVPGAADLGMNRQFWGFTTGGLVPWLNEHAPSNSSVWICDTTPTAFTMLSRDGRLRRDLRIAWDLPNADFAIVHHEDHFNLVDFQIWEAFGRVDPDFVLTYDGVPIVSVYRNPHRAR